jgi:transposase
MPLTPSQDRGSPMSRSPKRTFTREFKLQVVRQLAHGEKRISPLCREHTLSETVVRRWQQQYEQHGENAFREPGPALDADPQARIAELEASLGRAHLPIELLRRALEKGGSPPSRNGR